MPESLHRDIQINSRLVQFKVQSGCTNPGGRSISDDKLNMGFTQVLAQKRMYTEWRNCAKDQVIARGVAPAG